MDKRTYLTRHYWRNYLTTRREYYGFMPYDRTLCDLVSGLVKPGACLLDIGIGTGFPFAGEFIRRGYRVAGIDLAHELLRACRKECPEALSVQGTAAALPFPDDWFAAAYCFHSSWYFEELVTPLREGARVLAPGAPLIIDFQNAANADIQRAYARQRATATFSGRLRAAVVNSVKLVLRRGNYWHTGVFETPYTQPQIAALSSAASLRIEHAYGNDGTDVLREIGAGLHAAFPRLVTILRCGQ